LAAVERETCDENVGTELIRPQESSAELATELQPVLNLVVREKQHGAAAELQ